MARYIYRGPSDIFRIGDKSLVRDGEPAELTEEEERIMRAYAARGHRFEQVNQNQTKKKE